VKRFFPRLPRHLSVILISVFLWASIGGIGSSILLHPVSAEAQGSEKATLHRHDPLIREAMEVHHRHMGSLMRIPDVVGTGVGIGPGGLPTIKVFTARPGVPGIPQWLESSHVDVEVTGMVVALQTDPTLRYRPAPVGVSTGHPAITAGTIGARVRDAEGNVHALSNNHIYANQTMPASATVLSNQVLTTEEKHPPTRLGHSPPSNPSILLSVARTTLMLRLSRY
jgi:hypothetical protein